MNKKNIQNYLGINGNIISIYERMNGDKLEKIIEGELNDGSGFRTICTDKHIEALKKDGYKPI